MLALIIISIIVICIILIILLRNKEEIYRSGVETISGFSNGIYCIQKKEWNHEWYSIYRTTSEMDWSDKINEMKNNNKVFVEN